MGIYDHIVDNKIDCNIYGTNGELLIGVGTPISETLISKLSERKWYLDKPTKSIYDDISMFDDELVPLLGDEIDNRQLVIKAKKIVDMVLKNPIVFSNLNKIDNYDKYTYVHSNQVAYLSVAMGIKLNLTHHELINIAIASLTHDLGKCLIDEKIINKPGKLTKIEMDIVKRHSSYGYNIMKNCTDIDIDVLNAILFHHENFDGSGYPYGIDKEKIPLMASIIHICDVYEALTSIRPYKNKISEYESVNIIKNDSGKMFDPRLVDLFCNSMQIYGIGSEITLPSGEIAKITNIHFDDKKRVVGFEYVSLNNDILRIKKLR